MDDEKRAAKERRKAEARASKEVLSSLGFREQVALKSGFGGVVSDGVSIGYGARSDQWFPIAGCRASIRYGAIEQHQSFNRMAVGGAVAGWKGAAVGSVAKETAQNIWLDVEWPDGRKVSGLGVGEHNATKFADLVNRLSGGTSGSSSPVPVASPSASQPSQPAPPPPPPSVPAGWYPDAADAVLLRYWDGEQWTEHTAPRPPQ